MSKSEVQLGAEHLWQTAKFNAETNESFLPVAFLFHLDNQDQLELSMLPTPMLEDKDTVAAKIAHAAEQTKAIAVFFVAEAWAINRDIAPQEEMERALRGEIMAGDSKYREEVLCGYLETKAGTKSFSCRIDRSTGKKKCVDETFGMLSPHSGRFTKLLAPCPQFN